MRPDRVLRDKDGRRKFVYRERTISDMHNKLVLAIARDDTGTKPQRTSCRKPNEFTGNVSVRDYETMLRVGWPEGVEGCEGLEGLSTDAAERLQFTRSVGGAFPIIPAHLAGMPDAMLMPYTAPVDNVRGLTLVIDCSFNAKVSSDTVLTYARSVMRLVAWLASERIETSIYMLACISQEGVNAIYSTPVKTAGEILAPERIAACVHPCWLRRAYFAMVEHEYHDLRLPGASVCTGGYGTASTPDIAILKQVLPDAYSIILMPKVGSGDPFNAVQEAITLKLKAGGA